MKIDITSIIRDHLRTLRNAQSGKLSILDLINFFALPIVLASLTFYLKTSLDKDLYNSSLTFFGIFIALLLNIQVAIFSIHQRKRNFSPDDRVAKLQEEKLDARQKLLSELNANISYLILFCCFSLVSFLLLFAEKLEHGLAPAFAVLLYSHFLLTLLMIIKRSHALFQYEYSIKVQG